MVLFRFCLYSLFFLLDLLSPKFYSLHLAHLRPFCPFSPPSPSLTQPRYEPSFFPLQSELRLHLTPPPIPQRPPDHLPRRTLGQPRHEPDPARKPLGLVHAGGDPGFDLVGEGRVRVGDVVCVAGGAGGDVEAGVGGSARVGVGLGPSVGEDFATDEECTRLLRSVGAGDAHDGGVEDGGVGEEKGFELGGGDLVGGDFDEVLRIHKRREGLVDGFWLYCSVGLRKLMKDRKCGEEKWKERGWCISIQLEENLLFCDRQCGNCHQYPHNRYRRSSANRRRSSPPESRPCYASSLS